MPCLLIPHLYSVFNIILLLTSLKETSHNSQTNQRVMETFPSSERNYVLIEGVSYFSASMTTRLLSLFLFCLRDKLSCSSSPFLYQFPVSAVQNYYRFNGLKQNRSKSNTCLTGLNRGVSKSAFFSWGSRRESIFVVFSNFQKLPAFLGLWLPSVFKASSGRSSPFHTA